MYTHPYYLKPKSHTQKRMLVVAPLLKKKKKIVRYNYKPTP